MSPFLLCLLLLSYPSTAFHPNTKFQKLRITNTRQRRDSSPKPPCNEDNLMNFLAEIEVINPENIIQLSTKCNLVESCEEVFQLLVKVLNYTDSCKLELNLYTQLFKGVDTFSSHLCSKTPLKTRFLNVHNCLHELRNDLTDCDGPADWIENTDEMEVCKAYKSIADCYYMKTADVCGKNAAEIAKEVVEVIIDGILSLSQITCKIVRPNPKVLKPMPDDYISERNQGGALKASFLHAIITITICVIKFYTKFLA